jgi:hypothetical protein
MTTPEARLCSIDLESDMKTTTLGQTGLHVSRIAFGTRQLQPIESPAGMP